MQPGFKKKQKTKKTTLSSKAENKQNNPDLAYRQ